MRLLIDSHIAYWSVTAKNLIRPQLREVLEQPEHEIFFSVASLWELTIKASKGKLNLAPQFAETITTETGFEYLPVLPHHIKPLRDLPHIHKDPFDRLLIAQALAEGLTFVTEDAHLGKYGVPVF